MPGNKIFITAEY